MKVHRIIEYTPEEKVTLNYLRALRDTEITLTKMRRSAMIRAVDLGLPMRLVADFAGMSVAEVSRTNAGKRSV